MDTHTHTHIQSQGTQEIDVCVWNKSQSSLPSIQHRHTLKRAAVDCASSTAPASAASAVSSRDVGVVFSSFRSAWLVDRSQTNPIGDRGTTKKCRRTRNVFQITNQERRPDVTRRRRRCGCFDVTEASVSLHLRSKVARNTRRRNNRQEGVADTRLPFLRRRLRLLPPPPPPPSLLPPSPPLPPTLMCLHVPSFRWLTSRWLAHPHGRGGGEGGGRRRKKIK